MKTTHQFKIAGRTWTLYRRGTGKRQPGAETPWSFRMTVGGKRVLISTRTAHLETAVATAKARITGVVKGDLEALTVGRVKPVTRMTVGQACELYEAASLVRPLTAQYNVQGLKRILRAATGQGDVDGLPLTVVTAEAAEKYLAGRQGRERPDYGRTLKENTASNSTLRQAQSVFATRHRHIWKGLTLPACIDGFVKARKLKESDHRYVPIPEACLARMDAAADALEDRELWIVNRLIRLCGLRASEVAAAKTSWLLEHGGRLYLEIVSRPGEFVPKGHQGRVLVPGVLEPVFRERLAAAEAAGESAFLIHARNTTERRVLIYRTHSKWLREFLPKGRRKTNHELRKHAGSLVALKFNSWEAAARFLREDLETAKRHYLELLQPVGLEVEDLVYEAGPRARL